MLKAAFFKWKRKNYPEIEFSSDQVEYLSVYFNGVESGSNDPLPAISGQSVVQMLIAGFWEDMRDRLT